MLLVSAERCPCEPRPLWKASQRGSSRAPHSGTQRPPVHLPFVTENRSNRKAWLTYSLLRLAFFFVPLVVLYLIGLGPWWSAGFATLIGISLSVLLLSKPREQASESIYDWRNRDRTADDIVEDEILDEPADQVSDVPEAPAAADASAPASDADPAESPKDSEAPEARA